MQHYISVKKSTNFLTVYKRKDVRTSFLPDKLHHRIKSESRMSFFCKECNQCLWIFCDRLITDHVCKVIDSVKLFCSLIKSVSYEFFQFFRHPYDTLDTALSLHELLGGNEMFTMSHESRCLNSTTCHGCHLRECHSKWCHACILTVCNNNTVGEWLDTADTLEASAGSHRILHDGVQCNVLQSTLGEFLNCLINVLIRTKILIDRTLFCDDLARTSRVKLMCSFCIQP